MMRKWSMIIVALTIVTVCSVTVASISLITSTIIFDQQVKNKFGAIELQTPPNPAAVSIQQSQNVTLNGSVPQALSGATLNIQIRKSGFHSISTSDVPAANFVYNGTTYNFGSFTANIDNTIINATATITGSIPVTNVNVHPITNLFNGTLSVTYGTPYDYYIVSLSLESNYVSLTSNTVNFNQQVNA